MHAALLIITSLLAIAISILSTQILRYLEHRARNSENAGAQPMTDGTTTPPRPSNQKPGRKPWNPPFPTSPKRSGKQIAQSEYLILPPISPRHIDPPHDHVPTPHDNPHSMEAQYQEETEKKLPPHKAVETQHSPQKKEAKGHWGIMPVVWTSLAVLTCILLVLAFALLVAHCLACLVVYKTEARLGEARRGLVNGGEMRLCLCARG
jgi:hypothetical protein